MEAIFFRKCGARFSGPLRNRVPWRGAVRVVDVRGRALEVTTGVGMALRVVRLQVSADTRVTAAGADWSLAQLRPGDIVRVSYGARPTGFVAYTIERVGTMASGTDGAP